ncbi:MAG TPA: hypothetical protein PK052_03130 [Anaerohalosphaeraceae bacterium]|nr:hypothetical protein [Anaerohalosphaeraceae bacterium]HOL30952.1 hypothetical protein [Anaerohalosphaeraceae bacterium]HOM75330.1 hypothetical protein [Anaerohalosphaeraceae bacterium]HPC63318.1 hypothetical protein [Anaerohalosphaeraceae bacterium]HPO68976.1 hypothetical protein [Anaerohalosphaeraceae bacterium]
MNSEGIIEAWLGHRGSLDAPFGNFEPLEEINKTGIGADVCPAWNGQTLFYFQRQGEAGDLNATGIFVSHWVDDSYTDALVVLGRAVMKKRKGY